MIDKLRTLPDAPGIYQFFDAQGRLLYVGKAKSLKNRVKSYFRFTPTLSPSVQLGARIAKMASEAAELNYMVVGSESDALVLENSLIKQLRPKYNILLRDDKTYPYIVVDLGETYPRFEITRKVVKPVARGQVKYFGPFTSGSKELLDALYESFALVQKKNCLKGKKACLFYQIGRCLAPCEFSVDERAYKAIVNEAIDAIEHKERLVKRLESRMQQLSSQMRFEEAAAARDAAASISKLSVASGVDFATDDEFDLFAVASDDGRACVVRWFVRSGRLCGSSHSFYNGQLDGQFDISELYERSLVEFYAHDSPQLVSTVYTAHDVEEGESIEGLLKEKYDKKLKIRMPKIGEKRSIADLAVQNAFELLRARRDNQRSVASKQLFELLGLRGEPQRIEVFDASHLFGQSPVGAMIVWSAEVGSFDKSGYRHYNLDSKDEYAQMREILTHRAQSFDKNPPPDLWIIDGGKAQLSLAQEIVQSAGVNLPCIAIAKEKVDAKAHRAKGKAHDLLVTPQSEIRLMPSDARLQFTQRLRDEAHRFVIEFHRKQKRKSDKQVSLLQIRGIGEAKLKRALDYFGSFEAISVADTQALSAVFSATDAKAVFDYFHTKEV